MSEKWSQQDTKTNPVVGADVFLLIDSEGTPSGVSKQVTFTNLTSSLASSTQTLTNKTIAAATNAIDAGAITSGTLAVLRGGTGVTSSTGTVNVVLSNSPTLVTPALGIPTSATLTFATGLPLGTGTTGTLAVLRGGTGVTSSTGTINVVLSNSPTLVTPALGIPTSATLTFATGLPLTTGTTGILLVPKGGTGVGTFTADGVIVGNGVGNLQVTNVGTAGQILTSRGSGKTPIFADPAGQQFTDVIPANISIGTSKGFSSVIDLNPQKSQVSGYELPAGDDTTIFFKLAVPSNVDTVTPNARIRIHIITLDTNTSKNIRLLIGTHATSNDGNVNVGFTVESLVNIVPPETKESLIVQDVSLTNQPLSGQFITGEIFRDGDDAGDTASNILISKIELLIDRRPA